MMAVYHEIVRYCNIAVFLHKRHAEFAVRLIKIVINIKFGVIFSLHDGIVNACAGNCYPADEIIVFGVHLGILFKSRFFLRIRAFKTGLIVLIYQLRHL